MNCYSQQSMNFGCSQSNPSNADPSAFIMPSIESALPALSLRV
jgi:hypothetical protein